MEEPFDTIVAALQKNGGRITKQRKQLISLILSHTDCSPKELFYIARKEAPTIGRATVYRLMHSLEELGYIRRERIIVSAP